MSKIDDLTYAEMKQIFALFDKHQPMTEQSQLIGQHVVVRTYSAGVHIGTLVAKQGENVLLRDARRLWKWSGAFTLSEVAVHGIQKAGSRIACVVPIIELTNANEIIPTTEKARTTYELCRE